MIVVAGLLLGFHAIDAFRHFLAQYDRLLFAGPLLASLFDAGDAGLIVGFLGYGVYSVLNAYGAEATAGLPDVSSADRHGRIASVVQLALRPAPASFTIGSFAERLVGHLLVYTVILAAPIYICLFIFVPWPVSVGSIGLMLLLGIMSVAVSAPQGSFLRKLKWLVEIRIAVGSFVVAFAVLLLIEELLRRSS